VDGASGEWYRRLVPMKVPPAGAGPVALPPVDALSAPEGAAEIVSAEAAEAARPPEAVEPPSEVTGTDPAEAAFLAAVDADFRTELGRLCEGDPFLTARLGLAEET